MIMAEQVRGSTSGTIVAMPSRMKGCPGRRCAFRADGRGKKVTEYRATPADHPSWLVRLLWMATVIMGASAGFYLAGIRSQNGPRAAKAVLSSWKNLPWTFVGSLTTELGTELVIGIGIILPLLFFLVPRQVRQNTITLLGQLVFAVIVASFVGTIAYFIGIFVYDLGPYFRSR